MTRQAIQLGWCPRLQISQTSSEGYGQIYVGAVNWLLMIVTVGLTVGFGTSDRLAAAYGIAVSLTMLLTTGIQTAEQLAAASSNKARILIDHPHSYRDWIIVGKDAVPDFYHLKSVVWLDKFETTILELCLHESQFERV
jgi:hypothetical protein